MTTKILDDFAPKRPGDRVAQGQHISLDITEFTKNLATLDIGNLQKLAKWIDSADFFDSAEVNDELARLSIIASSVDGNIDSINMLKMQVQALMENGGSGGGTGVSLDTINDLISAAVQMETNARIGQGNTLGARISSEVSTLEQADQDEITARVNAINTLTENLRLLREDVEGIKMNPGQTGGGSTNDVFAWPIGDEGVYNFSNGTSTFNFVLPDGLQHAIEGGFTLRVSFSYTAGLSIVDARPAQAGTSESSLVSGQTTHFFEMFRITAGQTISRIVPIDLIATGAGTFTIDTIFIRLADVASSALTTQQQRTLANLASDGWVTPETAAAASSTTSQAIGNVDQKVNQQIIRIDGNRDAIAQERTDRQAADAERITEARAIQLIEAEIAKIPPSTGGGDGQSAAQVIEAIDARLNGLLGDATQTFPNDAADKPLRSAPGTPTSAQYTLLTFNNDVRTLAAEGGKAVVHASVDASLNYSGNQPHVYVTCQFYRGSVAIANAPSVIVEPDAFADVSFTVPANSTSARLYGYWSGGHGSISGTRQFIDIAVNAVGSHEDEFTDKITRVARGLLSSIERRLSQNGDLIATNARAITAIQEAITGLQESIASIPQPPASYEPPAKLTRLLDDVTLTTGSVAGAWTATDFNRWNAVRRNAIGFADQTDSADLWGGNSVPVGAVHLPSDNSTYPGHEFIFNSLSFFGTISANAMILAWDYFVQPVQNDNINVILGVAGRGYLFRRGNELLVYRAGAPSTTTSTTRHFSQQGGFEEYLYFPEGRAGTSADAGRELTTNPLTGYTRGQVITLGIRIVANGNDVQTDNFNLTIPTSGLGASQATKTRITSRTVNITGSSGVTSTFIFYAYLQSGQVVIEVDHDPARGGEIVYGAYVTGRYTATTTVPAGANQYLPVGTLRDGHNTVLLTNIQSGSLFSTQAVVNGTAGALVINSARAYTSAETTALQSISRLRGIGATEWISRVMHFAPGAGSAFTATDLARMDGARDAWLDLYTHPSTTVEQIEFAGNIKAKNFPMLGGGDGEGGDVPAGGSAGQVLSKIDGTNFNSQWVSPGIISSESFRYNNSGTITLSDNLTRVLESGFIVRFICQANVVLISRGNASFVSGNIRDLSLDAVEDFPDNFPNIVLTIRTSFAQDVTFSIVGHIHDLPAGGSTGQILSKTSGTSYATQWINVPSGGGTAFIPQQNSVSFSSASAHTSITIPEGARWVHFVANLRRTNTGIENWAFWSPPILIDWIPSALTDSASVSLHTFDTQNPSAISVTATLGVRGYRLNPTTLRYSFVSDLSSTNSVFESVMDVIFS